MDRLPDIKLPVWMNKGEPLTLAHASKTWWQRVYDWLAFPLAQIDVDTCDEELLSLLAYQRDIERFPGESLTLFRLRVKYAFVNAQDAGSMAGFERIFERLQIGELQQLERQFQYDWDVILLRINDAQLSRDNALIMRLVRQYGRTCRRYFFDVLSQTPAHVHQGQFCNDARYYHARAIIRPTSITTSVTELEVARGERATFTVNILPENATNKAFSAHLSDGTLADIETDGNQVTVFGLTEGAGEIVVTALDTGMTATVQLNVVYVYVTDIMATPAALRLAKDESVFVRVEVLPEGATDGSWVVADSDADIAGVTVVEGGIQVTALDWGETEITLRTNDGGLQAVIRVNVVDMAKFVMRIDSLDKVLFSVLDANDLTIDYGDGVDSGDFRVEPATDANYSGYRVYATRALTVGETYTLTVKGRSAERVGFYQGIQELTSNPILELVKLSGIRDGIDYLASYYSSPELVKIHPAALDLPYCTTANFAFQRTGLKVIPDDLFHRMPLLRSLQSTLSGCKSLSAIPPGLFDKNPLITGFGGTFGSCSGITAIPPDLFDNNPLVVTFAGTFGSTGVQVVPPGLFAGKSLVTSYEQVFHWCTNLKIVPDGVFDDSPLNTNLAYAFYGCVALESDIKNIFPLGEYGVGKLASVFNGCKKLTGSGSEFIARMPYASSYSAALRDCTDLKDYADLQANFPDWV